MPLRALVLLASLVAAASCGSSGTSGEPSPTALPSVSSLLPGLGNTGSQLVAQGSDGFTDQVWQVKCERIQPGIAPCPAEGAFVRAWRVLGAPQEWVYSTPQLGFAFWIGVSTNGYVPDTPGGDSRLYQYTYRVALNLTGYNPASVAIKLDWAGDNRFDGWRVNGGPLRGALPDDGLWTEWKPLTIRGTEVTFAPTTNTLEFQLTGDGVTDGLIVRILSAAASRR